jgi:K+:H+ antiporter
MACLESVELYMHVLSDVLTLLLLSVAAVAVLRRLKLPPILGYLFVGAAAGPHALGWLAESETIRFLGEIGVVFLLFTLGLEFSIPQFLAMKRTLFGLGGTQVLVGTASGGVIAWMLGLPWQAALIVGGALSMSSTAIVVKQLSEQLELQTPHGRMALGILLFQDLAAIPFLVMIPILAQSSEGSIALPLLFALLKALVAFALMLLFGRFALRPLFHEVGASSELFTLTALLVSLAAAWVTNLMGLSLALGAFLAGMMLSETEYRHQVENDIRPFRDVLLGLFFIVVGMQLDSVLLLLVWPWVLLLVAGLVLGKGPLIVLLTRLAGYRMAEALRTGIVLAHGGEFGVALLALALGTGLLNVEKSQPILASIVISMALAPILIRHSAALIKALLPRGERHRLAHDERDIAQALHGMRNHVLICGFGRVGQHLARFLKEQGFKYVALDTDPAQVKHAWEDGEQVYYGDATRRGILEAAGLKHAKALVVSFDHLESALKMLHEARSLNAEVPILVRATDESAMDQLHDAGATEVIPETLEASLTLATQLLLILKAPVDAVARRMEELRADRYRLLRPLFRGRNRIGDHSRSVILPAAAFAVGQRLADLTADDEDVLVTAVRREEEHIEAIGPGLALQPGDLLVLRGEQQAVERTERRLLLGQSD